MGIQINGTNDNISADDGSLSISGAELGGVTNINVSGISTTKVLDAGSGASQGQTVITAEGNYASNGNVDIQTWARIGGAVKAAMRYVDADTLLKFGTTTNHAFGIITNGTEKARINSSGDFLLGTTSTGAQIEIDTDNTYSGGDVGCGIRLYHTHTSLSANNSLLGLNSATTNSSSYRMAQFNSGTTRDSFGDAEFVLYGNGTGNADGSWNGGGADYAEYFEWSDGNVNDEDRRGISVVLDGNKIREALVGEDPIGVISGNPSIVGDTAWNKWIGKYLRDDYGSYVRDENGERQLNPSYDEEQEYIPREERSEWDCVGLMGKLRVRKGQITGSRWIKMRDVSDTVEEWLVR